MPTTTGLRGRAERAARADRRARDTPRAGAVPDGREELGVGEGRVGEDWRDPAVRAAAFGLAIDEHLDDWSAMAGAMLSDAELAFGSVVGAVTAAWERSIDLAGPADIAPAVERRLVAEARWRLQDRRPILGVVPPAPAAATAPTAPSEDAHAAGAEDAPDRRVVDRVARVLATAGAEHAIALGLLGLGMPLGTVAERMGLGGTAVRSLVAGGEEAVTRAVGDEAVARAGDALALVSRAVDRWRLPASDELRAAVRRTPGETRPLRSVRRRRLAAAAPWLAALVVAIGLVVLPSALDLVRRAGEPAAAWDPWHVTGGVVRVPEVPAAPWVPLIALPGTWFAVHLLVRRRGGLDPTRDLPRWNVGGVRVISGLVAAWIGLLLLVSPAGHTVLGEADAVAAIDVRPGGPVEPEMGSAAWIRETDGWGQADDEWGMPGAPGWIYRLRPGEPFWITVHLRNIRLVPVTVLGTADRSGRTMEERLAGDDRVTAGLALPREPGVVPATAADVVPFHPLLLVPGQEADVVLAFVAGGCAAPQGEIPAASGVSPGGGTWEAGTSGFGVVFDVLGWQVDGEIWPPVQIIVPATPGCLPDFP